MSGTFRVAIRHLQDTQRYEVFEVEASDLRDALRQAAERLPDTLLGTADLAEVRRAHADVERPAAG